jgi:hypothetical protein
METAFKRGDYQTGSVAAITRASALLAQHFPASMQDRNELPDKPLVI